MVITLGFLALNVLVLAPIGFRIMVGLNRRFSHLDAAPRYVVIALVLMTYVAVSGLLVVTASYTLFNRPPFCGLGFPPSADCPQERPSRTRLANSIIAFD